MRTLIFLLSCLVCLAFAGPARANGGDASDPRRVAVVAAAVSQLGVREFGFNSGPDVEKYIKFVGSPARSAWCSCFVSWVMRTAGVITARFGRARDWFDKKHIIWAAGQGKTPLPGDLPGYKWGSSVVHHVGIIEKWPPGVTAVTIEGNTSGGKQNREGDGVFRNWRDKRQMAYVADVISNPNY